MDWLSAIRSSFADESVLYSQHAKQEMDSEEFGPITDPEVAQAVAAGTVIEEYPDDRPYPRVLVYGRTSAGRPLHVVCAYDEVEGCAIVVTVYQPDPQRWHDYTARRQP